MAAMFWEAQQGSNDATILFQYQGPDLCGAIVNENYLTIFKVKAEVLWATASV